PPPGPLRTPPPRPAGPGTRAGHVPGGGRTGRTVTGRAAGAVGRGPGVGDGPKSRSELGRSPGRPPGPTSGDPAADGDGSARAGGVVAQEQGFRDRQPLQLVG